MLRLSCIASKVAEIGRQMKVREQTTQGRSSLALVSPRLTEH